MVSWAAKVETKLRRGDDAVDEADVLDVMPITFDWFRALRATVAYQCTSAIVRRPPPACLLRSSVASRLEGSFLREYSLIANRHLSMHCYVHPLAPYRQQQSNADDTLQLTTAPSQIQQTA